MPQICSANVRLLAEIWFLRVLFEPVVKKQIRSSYGHFWRKCLSNFLCKQLFNNYLQRGIHTNRGEIRFDLEIWDSKNLREIVDSSQETPTERGIHRTALCIITSVSMAKRLMISKVLDRHVRNRVAFWTSPWKIFLHKKEKNNFESLQYGNRVL